MKKLLLYIFFFLSFVNTYTQTLDSLTISGNYRNVSFEEFVESAESQTGMHFYYLLEWTDSIRFNFGGINNSITKVLDTFLPPAGISYIIKEKNVYLLPGPKKSYHLNLNTKESLLIQPPESTKQDPVKTDYEKRYLSSTRDVTYDTVRIGKMTPPFGKKKLAILGRIIDETTNSPIVGASIYIHELQIGQISDMEGYFNLKIQPGIYTGEINYINKKRQILKLLAFSDGIFTIQMDDKVIPIKEVTVVKNRYDPLANMNMGFEHLSTDLLKKLPVLLGEQDLLKALQLLPGVISGGEGTAGFYVRGGNADQNLIYFNKVPIYNTSHLFGFFSGFNSNAIKDLTLYKSNIPAQYGGRLASVLDIKAKKGNRKHFNLKGGISPITGNLLLEGPIVKDKGSIILGLRSSYSDYLLERLSAPTYSKSSAQFHDLTFSANYDLSRNNQLSVFSYYSSDNFSLAGINTYDYTNVGNSIIWKTLFNPNLSGEFALIDSRYNYRTSNSLSESRAFTQNFQIYHDEAKLHFSFYKFNNHTLNIGLNAILYRLNRGNIQAFSDKSLIPTTPLGKEKGVESAIYFNDQIHINKWLNSNVGLRYSHFAHLGPQNINIYSPDKPKTDQTVESVEKITNNQISQSYAYPEIRVSLNAALSKMASLKFAYNQMTQYLFMLSNTNAISPTDQWKLSDRHLLPQRSHQLSLGYYKNFLYPAINTSLELYRKKNTNVVEYKDGADLISNKYLEMDVIQGDQNAYGAELMIEKLKGKFTGWVSYAYSRSLITVDGNHDWDKINKGIQYASNFDKPHSFNLVSSYKINRRYSLSTNVVYSTGRPITYPKSVFYVENRPFINFSSRNEYRIPDYFRIDASLNIEGNLRQSKFWHNWWSFSIYNLTGRNNAYSVFFKQEDFFLKAYKLSIVGVPVFTITWNFKLGNYANN